MISIDTSILLFAYSAAAPENGAAFAFLEGMATREDVVLSEFVLTELYLLVRNPAVLAKPLSPAAASAVIQTYRTHPRWQVVGFPPSSVELHDELWRHAAVNDFPRRRIYDARMALTLSAFGVKDFATANVRDFDGFGFRRVWNPLIQAKA